MEYTGNPAVSSHMRMEKAAKNGKTWIPILPYNLCLFTNKTVQLLLEHGYKAIKIL